MGTGHMDDISLLLLFRSDGCGSRSLKYVQKASVWGLAAVQLPVCVGLL